MTTSIAATDSIQPKTLSAIICRLSRSQSSTGWRLLVSLFLLLPAATGHASTVLGPWIPIFKGVDRAVGTNTPGGGGFPDLQVMNAVRVNLTDPDIQLFTTPRVTNYTANYRETGGLTVSNYLTNYKVQVAANANNFHDPGTTDSPGYTLPPWSPFDLGGVSVSRGQVVSPQSSSVDAASIMFTTNNQASIYHTNWPAHPTEGIYTAVSGLYAVLAGGLNIGSNYLSSSDGVHQLQPRTLYGLSADRHYLFLVTIDGRQGGYSDGAVDWESASWLLRLGAWDGVNMDGGGSSCLVMADSTGEPIPLNHDSASAGNGRERVVGSHLGIIAKPIPGMINDVLALPDDTAATIIWTTTAPATTQVHYGLTTNFDSASSYSSALVTNHAALLTGLTPNTGYYFQAVSTIGGNQYASSNFFFLTTNYVVTSQLFDLTNAWTYTTANQDGVNWTASGYDDSGWSGPAMGALWTDSRVPSPVSLPIPLNTEMMFDSSTGNPFPTYYFRTHFTFTNNPAGTAFIFTDYVDDGAVFYLNGVELYRLRMPASPAPITQNTLAIDYPCAGNATCPDQFSVSDTLSNVLVQGDNVLAVEVHNFNAGSPDITFGLVLDYSTPYTLSPELQMTTSGSTIILSWDRGGFILQQADSVSGPWGDVPGPVFSSPYSQTISNSPRFFRLRK